MPSIIKLLMELHFTGSQLRCTDYGVLASVPD